MTMSGLGSNGPLTCDDSVKMHDSPDNGSTYIRRVDAKIIDTLKTEGLR
jgi:hypothetical protein